MLKGTCIYTRAKWTGEAQIEKGSSRASMADREAREEIETVDKRKVEQEKGESLIWALVL